MLVCLFALVALARSGADAVPQVPASHVGQIARDAGLADAGEGVQIVHAEPDAGVPESAGARALREGRPMNLNTATAADLELLPRIGPALAARIVEHRERRGPFRRVVELARVRGIGPRTVAGLRHMVTVETPSDTAR